MSNPDHWNSLASLLGADVPTPKQGAEEQTPAAQPPSPPKRPPSAPAVSKPPERREADWSQLASALGVTPTETPPVASAPPQSSRSLPSRAEPSQGQAPRAQTPSAQSPQVRQRSVPRDVAEPPKRHSEPRPEVEEFVAEEITSEEPIDAELVEGDDQAGTPAARHEDEERTGRKRRRRRRGGRRSKSGRSAAEEPPREAHDDDAQLAPLAESASDEEGPSEAGAPTEEPKGRPKRRRRRGSGRNRDKPRARSAEPKDAGDAEAEPGFEDEPFGVDDEPSELAAVASESDAGEFVDSESDAGEDEGADSPTDKNSHRAIPAWEEAIGYIVSVNMENRSKNPKSGPPRGRGRGRGNRGNSRGNNHRRPG